MIQRMSADARKKQIIDIAVKLFIDYGYESVVMLDIANACSIKRSSLYEYFSNKEAILFAVMDELIDELIAECKLSEGDDILRKLIYFICENSTRYQLIVQYSGLLQKNNIEHVMNWNKKIISIYDKVFLNDEKSLVARALVNQAFSEYLLFGKKIDIEKILNIVRNISEQTRQS